jgi:Xaa-Pro aminopeptidase
MTKDVGPGERAEYEHRLAAVRALMAEEGHDALVAADNDSWLLPGGHVRYLSGFSAGNVAGLPTYSAVVVPRAGEPTLVVTPGPYGCVGDWARSTAWIETVRSTPSETWPPEPQLVKDVELALKEYGADKGRIGICGFAPGLETLKDRLPRAHVEDAVQIDSRGIPRDIIERTRNVKSEWEVEKLGEAQIYAESAMRALMAAARHGVLLRAAVAEAEWAAKSNGAEDVLVPMNSGTNPWLWWVYQGDRVFHEGDLVSLETNARAAGYVAQLARSGVIGQPNAIQIRVLDSARAALGEMVRAAKPGVTGGELWDVAVETVRETGMSPWGRFGHGMGLSMAEGMDVLPGDDRPIVEGECVHLHAGVIDPGTRSSCLIGDQYIVRDGSLASLSDAALPLELSPFVAHE